MSREHLHFIIELDSMDEDRSTFCDVVFSPNDTEIIREDNNRYTVLSTLERSGIKL
jgi:hypothetical protein